MDDASSPSEWATNTRCGIGSILDMDRDGFQLTGNGNSSTTIDRFGENPVKAREAQMTSNNPCAVYNFYNCCNGNGSSAAQAAPFIWQSGNILDPTKATPTGTLEPLTPGFSFGNTPNAALRAYFGLLPLHKKAQLQEIMLVRFADMSSGSPYTAPISFDLVVMDFNGAVVRQISTAPIDYRLVPLRTWTPITLSAVAGDLDVMPGQLIAGQLTFGAAVPSTSFFQAIYQLSGTGVLLP